MLSTLLTIALLHWMVLVTPGANVLVVSNLAANGLRSSACFAALGVTVVAGIWSTLAILGVNAVFTAHPYLRLALQVAGGAYLLYVATRLWRTGDSSSKTTATQLKPLVAFRLGFLTNIMNPKSALFFGSAFVSALPPEPTSALLASVVLLVLVNALCWHIFLAIAFSHHLVQTTYARKRFALNRGASLMVGVLGSRILVATAIEARVRWGESIAT